MLKNLRIEREKIGTIFQQSAMNVNVHITFQKFAKMFETFAKNCKIF